MDKMKLLKALGTGLLSTVLMSGFLIIAGAMVYFLGDSLGGLAFFLLLVFIAFSYLSYEA